MPEKFVLSSEVVKPQTMDQRAARPWTTGQQAHPRRGVKTSYTKWVRRHRAGLALWAMWLAAACQDETRLPNQLDYRPAAYPGAPIDANPINPGPKSGADKDGHMMMGKGGSKSGGGEHMMGGHMMMDAGAPKDDKEPSGPLRLEFQGPPQIEHKNSRTAVVVDVVVRTATGTPLSPKEYKVTLLQAPTDRAITEMDVLDVESWLELSDRTVSSNLNFQLVLDASFSMLEHDPPAFEPMKLAAAESIEAVRRVWKDRGGEVTAGLAWFDEWIFYAQGTWSTQQLLSLDAPTAGTPTRLLGATHFMAMEMKKQYDAGVAAGERDRHVMLVFTDGKDNISSLDSTSSPTAPCRGFCAQETPAECQDGTLFPPCPNETTTGLCSPSGDPTATFRSYGYPCVDMGAVRHALQSHPNLVTHVVGLGDDISKDELNAIAEAGRGTAVFGAESGSIHDLFDEVLKQFVNVQSFGAHIPQSPGKYRFGLLVTTTGMVEGVPKGKLLCSFVYHTDSGFSGEIEGNGCSMN